MRAMHRVIASSASHLHLRPLPLRRLSSSTPPPHATDDTDAPSSSRALDVPFVLSLQDAHVQLRKFFGRHRMGDPGLLQLVMPGAAIRQCYVPAYVVKAELSCQSSVDAAFSGPGGSLLWSQGHVRQQLPVAKAASVYYAGLKYRRHYLENWCWTTPPRLTAPNSNASSSCLDYEPFEIFPHDAWARLENEQLEAFRKHAVSSYLKGQAVTLQPPLAVAASSDPAHPIAPVELANLRLDVNVTSSKLQPVYMPVFILEFSRFGANFRVFVCGATGQVGGESHTSPLKAYIATGAAVTTTLSSLPLDLIHVFAASGTAGAAFACALPLFRRYVKTLERAFVQQRLRARINSRSIRRSISVKYDDPRVPVIELPPPHRLIADDLILQLLPMSFRKRVISSSSSSSSSSSTTTASDRFDISSRALQLHHASASSQPAILDPELLPPPDFKDHLGYYQALGLKSYAVPASAVSDSMRRQARLFHPDTMPKDAAPDEQQAAAESFKRIITAYQVLRDNRRRRSYHLSQPPPTHDL